jgi:hypothetical protein
MMTRMLTAQPLVLAAPATVHLRLVQVMPPQGPADASQLEGEELPWLGERVESAGLDVGDVADARRFQVDLGLASGSGSGRGVLRKAAYVDLGRPDAAAGGWSVAIGWRAASLAPLFPVFAGRLVRTEDALVLEGQYAPPGGDLGVAVDRALLNIAARRTAVWLLRRFADALSTEPTTTD